MYEDKRIYVVVAETVQVRLVGGSVSVSQVCGRNMAQAAHVVSKARVAMEQQMAATRLNKPAGKSAGRNLADALAVGFEPVTTIILKARDTAELYHVWDLMKKDHIQVHHFMDENVQVYGNSVPVLTAICTEPVDPCAVAGVCDYLPLWDHSNDCLRVGESQLAS